jgi:hypothetical protein
MSTRPLSRLSRVGVASGLAAVATLLIDDVSNHHQFWAVFGCTSNPGIGTGTQTINEEVSP